ncbi:MAG: hypothetical protein ACD_16C00199G0005 [uncultured bacterium]|nr:MAG: hypothetical protein ACD_16C00199G0005 [uncultured bacterium]OGN55226.1 MAG: hypothetical protein A2796_01475 [Chlamydiae bacterium RIFCSPHIGHO2_01_FULL_44_39]OGN58504.1 MAG: hypothetical protein A3C42_05185 [Chlamydiae bacterium RIFCSPHIGHO2_02_FULL_45_9]OGN59722.1 MAG: hypothetical protein A3D96_03140 [Chlamydiae bacterium RIFCSPHIGHO2_12_FULL_44_59]OGN65805.1 MAG: hypothetical protein A2978_01200 [Chlamydiae bacterium RIFCSPLOWO2_01_FULL_44_52]OGN67982.1 MAG: hypothetical protein A3
MGAKSAIAATLQLFFIFACFLVGLFFVCFPYLPQLQNQVSHIFSAPFETCTHIGVGILGLTVVLTLAFYVLHRGSYVVIQMGGQSKAHLHRTIIQKAVEACLSSKFPQKMHLKQLEIGPKEHLDFTVTLTPQGAALGEALYLQVEEELNLLLKERFGYSKPFHLIVQEVASKSLEPF